MAQTIKIIIALAVLALLPACWGLKRPSPVTVTIAEICGGNPFNAACNEDYEVARIVKITECIAGDAAATTTCAGAVEKHPCIRDPFVNSCADDSEFSAYIARARNERATYCAADSPNATLCAGVAGSALLDNECLDSPVGDPAYPTCASRPNVVSICTDAPFTSPGCGNIPTIEMLRIAHCEDSATAWDDGCVETAYTGAVAARNTACLTHGINAATGGHADCAMRDNVVLACSETSPFAHGVCDAVGDIDIKRTTFCLKTADNGGANPFNEGCEQDTHGDVNMARDTACLASLSADTGCEARIMQTCEDTPLAGVSCAGLDGYLGFLDAFCIKDDNAMIVGCETTPAALCSADPFGVAVTVRDGTVDCSADTDYDSDRQALCASGMEGSGECDTDVIAPAVCASSGPNANPFATFCSSTNNIGGGDITTIRQDVVDLCLNNGNPAMAVCQNTDTVVSALTTGNTNCELIGNTFEDRCAYTQFDDERTGFCTARDTAWNPECNNNAHGNPTNARGQACVRFGTNTNAGAGGDSSCTTNDFAKNFCGTVTNNPFTTANTGCSVLDNFPTIVESYCFENPTQVDCETDYGAWNDSFTGGDALASAISASHTTNQFLSGLTEATDVPDTDFTGFSMTGDQKANAFNDITLADNDHGFDGQAEDGVMFFGGTFTSNSKVRYYAGVYTTTNLGAPLTSVSQTGVWQAWMRTSGKDPDSEGFELTVSFTESSKEGTLRAFFQSTSGTDMDLYYDINGRFGVNGVITGSVAIGTEDSNNSGSLDTTDNDYTLGRLTGLIGTEGVVAAFVSNTSTITADGNGDGINPFVGGFVAAPLVTYADWNVVASPDATLEDSPIANQFLADVVTNGGAGVTSVTLDSAQYNSASLGGEATDGFAYNTAGTTPDFVYYVGILPSTDLGLPLNNATQAGTWNGSFLSIENGTAATPADFTLTVTYGGASGSNVGSVASSAAIGNYNFTGEFDARGVIIGTITHTVTSPAEVISMGTLQGLIGQDGAVGVFISNSDASMDYGGGFVARKP